MQYYKQKIVILTFLLLFALVSGIISPPFYKEQTISITSIESHIRQSGFRTETYKNIEYTYIAKDEQVRYGKLNTYELPYIDVGDTFKYNVYTPISEGGEFYPTGFTLFFLFSAYFLYVPILQKLVSVFLKKELDEASAFIIAVGLLFAFLASQGWLFL